MNLIINKWKLTTHDSCGKSLAFPKALSFSNLWYKIEKTKLKKNFALFCREKDEQGFAMKSFDEALSLLILHHQYQLFNVIEISIIEMNHSDWEAVYIVVPVTNNCCKLRKFTDELNNKV